MIAKVQKGPEVSVASKNDMSATASISTIGSAHGREFITHEVLITGTTMAAATKYPDLIYEIAFLQNISLNAAKIP